MDPTPFLCGNAFAGNDKVPYPRASIHDTFRLPFDTWMQAQLPATVRLEIAGDAREIEIAYQTETEDLGYRGDGAGRTFALWRFLKPVSEEKAVLGEGRARLSMGSDTDHRAIVYLPEGMRPRVLDVTPIGGSIESAEPRKKWVCYGDSIAEGWIASAPAMAWPAIVAREHALDVVNMGYAGSARGEIVTAEHIAGLPADVISITHGTNCWTRIPHSVEQMRANTDAFLNVVRQGHPQTPILVASPIIRPDGEETANKLGATLGDLRAAMEDAVRARIDAGDTALQLIEGLPLVAPEQLGDGIHPNDDGHIALARALGPVLQEMAA
ncbi:MAG: GDSL family lipase [Actinobacteria bacterium]|nr:MAG: GDSL family lipase [Actinomycetota bacterium]